MQEDNNAIEKLVLVELMRLNGVILGVILGLLFGLGVFLATIILLLKGGDPVGPHLALLGQFFIGSHLQEALSDSFTDSALVLSLDT
jgi:hypothetical protein